MSENASVGANAPATQQAPKVPVAYGDRGLKFTNLDEALRFAQGLANAGTIPKSIESLPEQKRAGAVLAIIQAGAEAGLPPMWALSNVTFVNGRLGIMGDASLALVRKAGVLKRGTTVQRVYSGEPMTPAWRCTVTAHRADHLEPVSASFSMGDAVQAGIGRFTQQNGWAATKTGPWQNYPQRMLYYRALGFLLRDHFSDVLMGMVVKEELDDYTAGRGEGVTTLRERDVTPAKEDPLLASVPGVRLEPEPEDAVIVEDETGPAEPANPEPSGPLEEPVQESLIEDCSHPDGFSPGAEGGAPFCIHCGLVQPVRKGRSR